MLIVTNPYEVAITLPAFDGDTIQVQPGARQVPVEDKFEWQIAKSGLFYTSDKPVVAAPAEEAVEPAVEKVKK